MTLWRSDGIPATQARRPMSAVDVTAALMGGFATLVVLAVMGLVLTSGIAGVDIFDSGKLERFALPTVATTIVVVLVSFFCGGWVHGVLRGIEKRGLGGQHSSPGDDTGPKSSSP